MKTTITIIDNKLVKSNDADELKTKLERRINKPGRIAVRVLPKPRSTDYPEILGAEDGNSIVFFHKSQYDNLSEEKKGEIHSFVKEAGRCKIVFTSTEEFTGLGYSDTGFRLWHGNGLASKYDYLALNWEQAEAAFLAEDSLDSAIQAMITDFETPERKRREKLYACPEDVLPGQTILPEEQKQNYVFVGEQDDGLYRCFAERLDFPVMTHEAFLHGLQDDRTIRKNIEENKQRYLIDFWVIGRQPQEGRYGRRCLNQERMENSLLTDPFHYIIGDIMAAMIFDRRFYEGDGEVNWLLSKTIFISPFPLESSFINAVTLPLSSEKLQDYKTIRITESERQELAEKMADELKFAFEPHS